jgi:hypothetical protein
MSGLGKAMMVIAALLTIGCIAALIGGHFQLPSGRFVGDLPFHMKGSSHAGQIILLIAASAALAMLFWPPRR